MKRLRTQKSKKSLYIISSIVVVALLCSGLFAYQKHRSDSAKTKPAANTGARPYNSVNYGPATAAQKSASEQQKNQPPTTPTSTNSSTSTPKQVTPVIVDASQYSDGIEVRSYVPGIVENGGNCTVTFTQNSTTLTKQTPGIANAQDTTCQSLTVPRSFFPTGGQWNVVVTYTSSTSTGASQTAKLTVT